MKVLVTNDDGIFSNGISCLIKEISTVSEVYVVAPDRERSASSHSITFDKPLRVDKVSLPFAQCAWKVNGTPADCVKIAIHSLLEFKPDVVISGINRGPNVGSDVLYSGTVAAAIEGHINGIAGIAVSHASYTECDYAPAARVTRELFQLWEKNNLIAKSTIVSINIPVGSAISLRHCRITSLGERKYENVYDLRVDPRGREYYWLSGDVVKGSKEGQEGNLSDINAIEQGIVSITPLKIDLTDYAAFDLLNECL